MIHYVCDYCNNMLDPQDLNVPMHTLDIKDSHYRKELNINYTKNEEYTLHLCANCYPDLLKPKAEQFCFEQIERLMYWAHGVFQHMRPTNFDMELMAKITEIHKNYLINKETTND